MIKILLRVCVTALTLLLISRWVPGIAVASLYIALILAIVWGILGLTVKPVLKILTLPINIITFGLFSLALNALLFWFLASFIKGFFVAGFIPALEGSLILSIVGWVLHTVL